MEYKIKNFSKIAKNKIFWRDKANFESNIDHSPTLPYIKLTNSSCIPDSNDACHFDNFSDIKFSTQKYQLLYYFPII